MRIARHCIARTCPGCDSDPPLPPEFLISPEQRALEALRARRESSRAGRAQRAYVRRDGVLVLKRGERAVGAERVGGGGARQSLYLLRG